MDNGYYQKNQVNIQKIAIIVLSIMSVALVTLAVFSFTSSLNSDGEITLSDEVKDQFAELNETEEVADTTHIRYMTIGSWGVKYKIPEGAKNLVETGSGRDGNLEYIHYGVHYGTLSCYTATLSRSVSDKPTYNGPAMGRPMYNFEGNYYFASAHHGAGAVCDSIDSNELEKASSSALEMFRRFPDNINS